MKHPATPMSHGLSVFLLIDSGSVVTGCPRDWCPNIPSRETKQWRFQAAGENQSIEHYGAAGHKSIGFNFPVCMCAMFDSRLCLFTV